MTDENERTTSYGMKQEIDAILHSILHRDPADLYWSGEFLRWGAVQRDLHAIADKHEAERTRLLARIEHLQTGYGKELELVEQELGAALGYPRYCDDQVNFPGTTEADGVCVGEHVAGTIAMEAAARIAQLKTALADERRVHGEVKWFE